VAVSQAEETGRLWGVGQGQQRGALLGEGWSWGDRGSRGSAEVRSWGVGRESGGEIEVRRGRAVGGGWGLGGACGGGGGVGGEGAGGAGRRIRRKGTGGAGLGGEGGVGQRAGGLHCLDRSDSGGGRAGSGGWRGGGGQEVSERGGRDTNEAKKGVYEKASALEVSGGGQGAQRPGRGFVRYARGTWKRAGGGGGGWGRCRGLVRSLERSWIWGVPWRGDGGAVRGGRRRGERGWWVQRGCGAWRCAVTERGNECGDGWGGDNAEVRWRGREWVQGQGRATKGGAGGGDVGVSCDVGGRWGGATTWVSSWRGRSLSKVAAGETEKRVRDVGKAGFITRESHSRAGRRSR